MSGMFTKKPIARVILKFFGNDRPVLEETVVLLPPNFSEESALRCRRGKRQGGRRNVFQWTPGPKALSIYFVSYADWGSRGKKLRHFVFPGGDGSPADTLETTVMQKDGALDWSADMFGGVEHNHTLLDQIIERLTPRKTRGDRPFEHGVKVENFPVDALTINCDNRVLDKPLQFEELVAKLYAQWPDEAQGKPGAVTASKAPETTPPAQVAAQQTSASPQLERDVCAPPMRQVGSSSAPPSASHPGTSTSAEPITSPQTGKKTSQAPCSLKGIQSSNASFNRRIDRIGQEAVNITKPILLLGPIGTGKTDLAKRIYDLRVHRGLVTGEFITVDCTTIRGDMAMSALFGHVRGAFTGATHRREGLLRAADKGVIFFDEIGDLGIEEQSLLVRALETKRFRPIGDDKEVQSDFQFIAATSRNLGAAVRTGAFRKDLWTRIRLWSYELPGLRDRLEDIEPNLDYELQRWTQENGKRVRMNSEVRARFLSFAKSPEAKWTANLRDLKEIVELMAFRAENGIITPDVLESEIEQFKQWWASEEGLAEEGDAMLRSLLGADRLAKLDLTERFQLSGVIRVCRESRSAAEAGRKLYAATRHAESNDSDRVVKYLKQFGLRFSDCTNLSSSNA